MPRGYQLSEDDRICVLRLWATRRYTYGEIAVATMLDRKTVARVIGDAAIEYYQHEIDPKQEQE